MPYAVAALVVLVLATLVVFKRLRNPHVLARMGSVDRLRRVLADSPEAVDQKGPGGETPLMHAAKYDERDTTQLLLKAGANPNAICEGGGTALMMASACGCNGTVPLLLSAGADVNAADDAGVTPLHYAVGAGLVDTVRLLVAAGADKTMRDAAGRTPREVAAEAGLEDLAKMVSDGA